MNTLCGQSRWANVSPLALTFLQRTRNKHELLIFEELPHAFWMTFTYRSKKDKICTPHDTDHGHLERILYSGGENMNVSDFKIFKPSLHFLLISGSLIVSFPSMMASLLDWWYRLQAKIRSVPVPKFRKLLRSRTFLTLLKKKSRWKICKEGFSWSLRFMYHLVACFKWSYW